MMVLTVAREQMNADRLRSINALAALLRTDSSGSSSRRQSSSRELVLGVQLYSGNFHGKVTGMRGFVEPISMKAIPEGRPAELYRRGRNDTLHPALTRTSLG